MLYIVMALKPEVQAFVDKYRLKKSKLSCFTIFSNSDMIIIVSGIGVKNSTLATQTLIDYFDVEDGDIYLNIGICGADKTYEIGELLEIGMIKYEKTTVNLQSASKKLINCVDKEVTTDIYPIADMESFGFYDAVIHSSAIKNYYIFKVVSDHFEPEIVTKESAKILIFNALKEILSKINLSHLS